MVRVGDFCVDRYEASVWDNPACDGTGTQFGTSDVDDYPESWPVNGQYSTASDALYACSVPGVLPSGWVSYLRASAACAESGKRLCRNHEWQTAVIGTPYTQEACPTATGEAVKSDAYAETCVSRWGTVGMIGNMQEWVADWVVSGATWYTEQEQTEAGPSGVKTAWPSVAGVPSHTFGINGSAIAGVSADFAYYSGLPSAILRSGSYGTSTWSGPLFVNAVNSPVVAFRSGGFRCCASAWTHPKALPRER